MPAVSLPYPPPCPASSLDTAVLRRIGYTCLACPVPAMPVDVGPTPLSGSCLLPSTWYVALPGEMAPKAAAGSGWSFVLCAREERNKAWKSLRVAYTPSYLGGSCDTRGERWWWAGPCGSGTLHPVLVQTSCPLRVWVVCD